MSWIHKTSAGKIRERNTINTSGGYQPTSAHCNWTIVLGVWPTKKLRFSETSGKLLIKVKTYISSLNISILISVVKLHKFEKMLDEQRNKILGINRCA